MCKMVLGVTSLFFLSTLSAFADESDLEKIDGGVRHKPTKLEFKAPEGWEVGKPRPLPDGVSLALDKTDPRVAVTLIWAKLSQSTPKDIVDPDPPNGGGYGTEYQTLAKIYGAVKVGKPKALKVSGRIVYRIDVETGPSKDNSVVGLLYVFFVDAGSEGTWRIKLRATFPKKDREEYAKQIEELVGRYRQSK